MKRYKILFFLLLLCSIQPSWACINDPEDWNNNEEDGSSLDDEDDYAWERELPEIIVTPNHDDYAWERELPEIIVTPNHDDDDDDDGFSFDDDDDDDDTIGSNVNGDEGWWDDDDDDQLDDDDYNDVTSHSNLPENHLKLISTKLPRSWIKTYDKNSCVVTSMEYIWNIINQNDPPIVFNRFIYESKYEEWHPDYNPMNDPIKLNDLERLIGEFFEYHELDKEESYKEAILNNDPILTIIEGISEGLPCLHEITIVGFDDEKEKYYYIDPSSGLYNYIGFDDIIGPSYCVTGNN